VESTALLDRKIKLFPPLLVEVGYGWRRLYAFVGAPGKGSRSDGRVTSCGMDRLSSLSGVLAGGFVLAFSLCFLDLPGALAAICFPFSLFSHFRGWGAWFLHLRISTLNSLRALKGHPFTDARAATLLKYANFMRIARLMPPLLLSLS